VITAPPLLAGAVHETVADAFPAVATPIVGAPGTVALGGGIVVEPPLPPPQAVTNSDKMQITINANTVRVRAMNHLPFAVSENDALAA
jgi:hypothetical protein